MTHSLIRRAAWLMVIFAVGVVLFLSFGTASSQNLPLNCAVSIDPKIGLVKVRATRNVDDNSWMMIISLQADGTMVVTSAKTYNPNIWAEGTVIASITATRLVSDQSGQGYHWVQVTIIDDKGNKFPLAAYLAEKSPQGGFYIKMVCQTAVPPTAPSIAAPTSAGTSTTAAPTTASDTGTGGNLPLATVTLTPTSQNTPTQAPPSGPLPTIAVSRIYYVSCLKNGVGPDIDQHPFNITNMASNIVYSIPVGTYVVRSLDDSGNPIAANAKGQLQVQWGDEQWLIAQNFIKQPGADGSTDCDGHITPMPTPHPLAPSTPTATLDPSQASFLTPNQTDFGDPDFGTLPYAVSSPFGIYRPVAMAYNGTFPNGTTNLLRDPIATCMNGATSADILAGKCDPVTPDKLAVISPVAGCLYHEANTPSVIIVISRSGIGCKDAVQYPRLEIVLVHLDPASISGIKSNLSQSVKPGDYIGSLCTPKVASDTPAVCGGNVPFMALQFRVNKTFKDGRAAGDRQLYALLPMLRK